MSSLQSGSTFVSNVLGIHLWELLSTCMAQFGAYSPVGGNLYLNRCFLRLSYGTKFVDKLSVQVCACVYMRILNVSKVLRIFFMFFFFNMAHARNVWGSIVGLNVRPSRV